MSVEQYRLVAYPIAYFLAGALVGSFAASANWLRIYREDLGRLTSVIEKKLQ